MASEADTCRTLNLPEQYVAGWTVEPNVHQCYANENIGKFGGADQLHPAAHQLQSLL